MQLRKSNTGPLDLETQVRQKTGVAAWAAALLIFFGFFWFEVVEGGGWAAGLFVYTLRLGGLAMVGVAVCLALGQPIALVADAVVSILIGVIVIVTSVLMVVFGGWAWPSLIQALINIACGSTLASSGLACWYYYRALERARACNGLVSADLTAFEELGRGADMGGVLAESGIADGVEDCSDSGALPEPIGLPPVARRRSRFSATDDAPLELDGLSPGGSKGGSAKKGQQDSYLAELARREQSKGDV